MQDDIQLELAHLLVDLRTAGACDAISACFDSGVAEQIIINNCILSKKGRCSPSVDLREVYHSY
jgi:hypothetical protein